MSDDSIRRLNRLAERAKKLDDLIQNAAKIQKQIVEEIRRIGERDKLNARRPTATLKPRPKGRGGNGERARRSR
jgi:hypothetical protein